MVQRAADCKLTGDEPALEELYNDQGPEAVDHLVSSINNALDASEGFEDTLGDMNWMPHMFYAPIFNTSVMSH